MNQTGTWAVGWGASQLWSASSVVVRGRILAVCGVGADGGEHPQLGVDGPRMGRALPTSGT